MRQGAMSLGIRSLNALCAAERLSSASGHLSGTGAASYRSNLASSRLRNATRFFGGAPASNSSIQMSTNSISGVGDANPDIRAFLCGAPALFTKASRHMARPAHATRGRTFDAKRQFSRVAIATHSGLSA